MKFATVYIFVIASIFIAGMVWNILDKRKKLNQNKGSGWTKQFSILSSIIVILAIIYVVFAYFIQ